MRASASCHWVPNGSLAVLVGENLTVFVMVGARLIVINVNTSEKCIIQRV
jgi:hypothetical protein